MWMGLKLPPMTPTRRARGSFIEPSLAARVPVPEDSRETKGSLYEVTVMVPDMRAAPWIVQKYLIVPGALNVCVKVCPS